MGDDFIGMVTILRLSLRMRQEHKIVMMIVSMCS